MVQRLDREAMSRDPEVCREYDADELCHDTGTLEGLAGMLQRGEELDKGEVQIADRDEVSVWVGHGTGDRVCSFEATQRLVRRMDVRDKEFRIYDGWFHKCELPGRVEGKSTDWGQCTLSQEKIESYLQMRLRTGF